MKKVFYFIVAAFFLIVGIGMTINNIMSKEYNHPVYISKEITASGYANNIIIY